MVNLNNLSLGEIPGVKEINDCNAEKLKGGSFYFDIGDSGLKGEIRENKFTGRFPKRGVFDSKNFQLINVVYGAGESIADAAIRGSEDPGHNFKVTLFGSEGIPNRTFNLKYGESLHSKFAYKDSENEGHIAGIEIIQGV